MEATQAPAVEAAVDVVAAAGPTVHEGDAAEPAASVVVHTDADAGECSSISCKGPVGLKCVA